MRFKFTADVNHESFDAPLHHEVYLEAPSLIDLVNEMGIPDHCKHNLIHHRRAGATDARGVKHKWAVEEVREPEQLPPAS